MKVGYCSVCQATSHIKCTACGGWRHGDGSHVGQCGPGDERKVRRKYAPQVAVVSREPAARDTAVPPKDAA